MEKYFIITVDTEGDNLWNPYQNEKGYREITTENSKFLPRFQSVCEEYGFIPTYLTNYEMALDRRFQQMARRGIREKKLEVGMHMHAWNCPPLFKLPYNKNGHNAYAGDFPQEIIYSKMEYLTNTLKDIFECEITSHRGGRWYLDNNVCKALIDLGYLVDCTVTPGISWENALGNKIPGTDYSKFSGEMHELEEKFNVERDRIIEVPPSICLNPHFHFHLPEGLRDVKSMMFRKKIWFRPNGQNTNDMLYIIKEYDREDKTIEFMIHSSELMPGGSPVFKTRQSIEKLYRQLDVIFFNLNQRGYKGISLSDYAKLMG